MKIVVLVGGLSMEREISLASGCQIHNALIEAGHHVLLLDSYLGYNGDVKNYNNLFSDKTIQKHTITSTPPHIESLRKNRTQITSGYFGPNVLDICKHADIVFIALHGADGENGKIQAVFDLLEIKYTGTNYQGALFALNKDISKKIMKLNNIRTAEWEVLEKSNYSFDYTHSTYPVVIKPTYEGSSIGVSIVKSAQDFSKAVQQAFLFGDSIIIEKYISGREFSVGIIGSTALPPIEIIPRSNFFDYQNKYQSNCTLEICPAELSATKEAELKRIALKVHQSLCLSVYSRIDFIQDAQGDFYCLEANALPGMTPESLLPKEAYSIGYSFSELCNEIVSLSLQQYQQ